jgi:hypothetical protein
MTRPTPGPPFFAIWEWRPQPHKPWGHYVAMTRGTSACGRALRNHAGTLVSWSKVWCCLRALVATQGHSAFLTT